MVLIYTKKWGPKVKVAFVIPDENDVSGKNDQKYMLYGGCSKNVRKSDFTCIFWDEEGWSLDESLTQREAKQLWDDMIKNGFKRIK
jgi:hypothetical protein